MLGHVRWGLVTGLAGMALALSGPGAVHAADFGLGAGTGALSPYYFHLFGGPSIPQAVHGVDESSAPSRDYVVTLKNPGYLVGGAVGMRFSKNWRAEGEVAYRRYALDHVTYTTSTALHGYADALSFMGNIWYDVPHGGRWTPYVGGGAGIARATYNNKNSGFKASDNGFIFQLGAGVNWMMTDNIALDVGYRFRGILDLRFSDSTVLYTGNNYYGHNVVAGVTVGF